MSQEPRVSRAGVPDGRGEVVDDAPFRRAEDAGEALRSTRVRPRDHPVVDGLRGHPGLLERLGRGSLAERDIDVLAEALLPLPRGRLAGQPPALEELGRRDRKSTRLNSSHGSISYAVFCLK